MKKLLLSLILVIVCIKVSCTTWTIVNSGFTFSPSTITITIGDDVNFVLASIHDAVEVSKATWDANGNTPLGGGFQTPFGGGLVQTSQLGIGIHYYVCSTHASIGMKGMITVQSITGIPENQITPAISVYPNPTSNIITIGTIYNISNSRYYIFDYSGRKIMDGKIADGTKQLDLSYLTRGVYYVHIDGLNERPLKVIKE